MGYRMIKPPEHHHRRDMDNKTTGGVIFLEPGTTAKFSIPCWYRMVGWLSRFTDITETSTITSAGLPQTIQTTVARSGIMTTPVAVMVTLIANRRDATITSTCASFTLFILRRKSTLSAARFPIFPYLRTST